MKVMMPKIDQGSELTRSRAAALGAPVRERLSPEPSKPTVVIADDHLLLAQGLAELLAVECDVIAAVDNGRELLAIAAERRPDVALIDVCMPGLTGMEVTRSLRKSVPACKVILISMYAQSEFVSGAFSVGALVTS